MAGLSGDSPGLRVVGAVGPASGGAEGASGGGPGQVRAEVVTGEGLSAVFGAGGEVAGEQVQGSAVVWGCGGGDGLHVGGEVSRPRPAPGAVEVLRRCTVSAARVRPHHLVEAQVRAGRGGG